MLPLLRIGGQKVQMEKRSKKFSGRLAAPRQGEGYYPSPEGAAALKRKMEIGALPFKTRMAP